MKLIQRIPKCVALILIVSLLVGTIPVPCIDAAAAYFSARAEEHAAGEGVQTGSDDTVSGDGWIYRICADGYAEVLGHTDASAANLSIPYSLGGAWVVRIGADAFADNAALSAIFIPGSITEIPESAVPNQTALTVRAYNGSEALAFARSRGFAEENLSEYDFFDDVIDLTELKSAQWSFQGSASIRISDPWARRIEVGTKMYIPPCRKYVSGMPVQAESVSMQDGSAIVAYSVLNFVDAVETYHAENVDLYMDVANTVILADGFELAPGAQSYEVNTVEELSFPVKFDVKYKFENGVEVNGGITVDNKIKATVDYGWFKINEIKLSRSSKTEIKVSVSQESEKYSDKYAIIGNPDKEQKIEFARVPIVQVGPISGYVKLQLNISCKGEVSVGVAFETSETYTFVNDQLTSEKSKTTKDWSLSAAIKVSAKLEGSIILTLGFGGVGLDFFAIELSGGAEIEVGGQLTIHDPSTAEEEMAEIKGISITFNLVLSLKVKIGLLNEVGPVPAVYSTLTVFDVKIKIAELYWNISFGKWIKEEEVTGSDEVGVPLENVRVRFYTGTLDAPADVFANLGSTIDAPPTPTREGFTFLGWTAVQGSDELWDFESDVVTGDMTLYACWEVGGIGENPDNPGEETDPTEMTPEEAASLEYLVYTSDSRNACIIITGLAGEPTELTIPRYIGYKPVRAIGNLAFYNRSCLVSVTLPDTMTEIGNRAFSHCSNLESITFPDSMKRIGSNAFNWCNNLASVTIPDSVTSIGSDAFSSCSNLASIYIDTMNQWLSYDHTATSLYLQKSGGALYVDGELLTEVVLPESVKSIGGHLFSNCSSLTNVTIPDSVRSIGGAAFDGCSSITSVTIPDSVTSIEYSAFSYCSSLTSITIPDGVTSIESSAFYHCRSLTGITIPDSVTSIGSSAFYYCSSLSSITIPDSVTSIGVDTFSYCRSLTSITIPDGVTSINRYTFYSCSSLTSITIPDSVTSIGGSAFYGCSSLTSIMIPDSVTSIGDYTFYGCSSLTHITIPDGVTSIGSRAFYGCSSLTSVTIPDSVTSIGDYAFLGCYGLTCITIPDSVTSFGSSAFYNCSKLKYLYTDKGSAAEAYFTENYPNVTILYLNGDSHLLSFNSNGGTGVESHYVSAGSLIWKPSDPTRANYSFTGWYRDAACTQAWDFGTDEMPDANLTLYAGWSYLPSGFVYDVRDGAATITAYTGDEIYLNVPAALGGVPVKALEAGCIGSGVRRIALPETLSSVDAQAFRWAMDLHTITVAEENPYYSSADGVLYASDGTLVCYPRARRTDSFTPAAGTTAIDEYAFYAADGLGALVLPDGLASIGSRAIYGCDRLESLNIPASVSVLGDYAVYGCGALERIDFAADPAEIGSGCFVGCGDGLAMFGPENAKQLAGHADAYLLSYNEYLITYMMYGEVLACTSARAGAHLGMPPKPEDGEMSFKGWSLEENGALWNYETVVMPAHEITLHAIWKYDFSYEAVDGGVKLLKYTGDKRSIRVPGTVDGKAVVSIADGCFEGLTGITLLAERGSIAESYASAKGIPFEAIAHTLRFESNGGTYIAPCTKYATDAVEAPVPVRTNYNFLGWYADAACTQVWDSSDTMPAEDLTLYARWEKIDERIADVDFEFSTAKDGLTITAYTGRKTTVTIPAEINGVPVVAIGAHAFDGDQVMFSVTVPGSIRRIGNAAFASSRVSSLVLESGVTEIGAHAFDSCYELQSILLPDTLATIGAYAFQDCGSLLRLSLPDHLTTIPEGMLAGCGNLASFSLPTVLEAIGASAFEGCNALRTLALGQAVSDVQISAFNGCGNLKEILVADANLYYKSADGVLLSANGTTLLCYPQGKTDSAYAIPASVTAIGEAAMANSRIKSLTLNDQLAFIGEDAIRNSRYLSKLTFPASSELCGIGTSAFQACSALKALDLPASLEYIGDRAFDGCGLTSVSFYGDTVLGNDAIPANPTLTFYGNRGDDAESYAEYYGIRFVDLSVDVPVEGIAIEPALSMMTGGTAQLSVAYTPKNTTEREIQWSSSDASVVAVNAEGILSARYEGTAVISAKAKDGSVASCTVTVVKPKMQKIELSDVQVVLMLGNEFTLTATLPGDDSGTIVTWGSTNPQVASVEDGVIFAHHTGSTEILAAAPGYEQAVCQVDVIAPEKMEGGLLLPQALTQIDAEAFMGGAFESVILPEGTLYIGERAFADCTLLRQIQIPASVESIAEDAFEGYNDLIIFCPLGSAAEAYAIAHRISCAAE